jgi:nucleotide-binding universal stress UspA family protein
MKYTKIVVPLDGSELAEVALPFAEENAGRTGAKLILISVRAPDDDRSEFILKAYLEKRAEIARMNAEKYQKNPGGEHVWVTWEILNGDPAEEIINFSNKEEGCRVVMAAHGKSGLTRWALGSVADKMTTAINVPVTIIRAKGSEPSVHERGFFSKILAPLDGSKESEVILPHVEELARNWQADVTFFLVFGLDSLSTTFRSDKDLYSLKVSTGDYLEKLIGTFHEDGINANYIMKESSGKIADEINKYTAENYIDLVVMATHGRSGPHRWILGSVTNKVLHEGNTPIMLIRTLGEPRD